MAEVIISIKFQDQDPISLVLESGGEISGGVTMNLEQNQLLKSNIGKPYSLKGSTRMSIPLIDKLEQLTQKIWNDNITASVLHKIVNGTEVISSRFFKKAIFTGVNPIKSSDRGGKVSVDIEMELIGEEGYNHTENSL